MHYNPKPDMSKLVQLDLTPSHPLAFLFGFVGVFASVCVLITPMSFILKLLICVVVTFFCIYTILHHALLRLPWSIVSLVCNLKGEWHVINRQGKKVNVNIHASSFVAAYFTVVNMHVIGKKRLLTILILPSIVQAEAFRRLRVHLRWQKFQIADSAEAVENSD